MTSAPKWTDSSIQVSLLVPVHRASAALAVTVKRCLEWIDRHAAGPHRLSAELIVIPNPAPDPVCQELLETHGPKYGQRFRIANHHGPIGKGAALQTGFEASRGRWILTTDADLPYDLSFFDEALEILRAESPAVSLVYGNRRRPDSEFTIPVRVLPLAYGRHRLGVLFNRLVRLVLPIHARDTQAGIKAFRRELGEAAFRNLQCRGFLYDLELFLKCWELGYESRELPISHELRHEKSSVRVIRESIAVVYWLNRFYWRVKRIRHRARRQNSARPASPRVPLVQRVFLVLRQAMTPYRQMLRYWPDRGELHDLGCGHGLLTTLAARLGPERTISGYDHDTDRVKIAKDRALRQGLERQTRFYELDFEASLAELTTRAQSGSPADGLAMIDVLHYFDLRIQARALRSAFEALRPGGVLLVRELDPEKRTLAGWINLTYERLATGIGFTRMRETQGTPQFRKALSFRTPADWTRALQEAGFDVHHEACTHPLFADRLYVGTKPAYAPYGGNERETGEHPKNTPPGCSL